MEKVKVGVVGVGHLGSAHAKIYANLNSSVKLITVCDINEGSARKVAERFKTQYCTDYRQMFGQVDAVSVVVPTSLHYSISKDFIRQGIHVLIEKPITKTLEEADELIRLAKEKSLILQVGHIERFNSAVLAIEPYLKIPKFIECQRINPYAIRAKDVGVVMDLMIHDIDIVLGLVKSEVTSLEAVGASTISAHEDIANVRISFANGAIADITASRVSKDAVRKIRIFQEDSYLLLDYLRQEAVVFTKTGGKITQEEIRFTKAEPLKEELKSFISCIRTNTRPIVSGQEGRRALQVALTIVEKINNAKKRA